MVKETVIEQKEERAWNRARRRLAIGVRCAVVLGLLMVLVRTAGVPPSQFFQHRLREQTGGLAFDFASWELGAWLAKGGYMWLSPQDTLDEGARKGLVVAYLDAQRRANGLREEIERLYSQQEGVEAAREAAPVQASLQEQRAWMAERQSLVEGILEAQVSTELQVEGFGRWGYVWPPVKIRFTELPLLLVISKRAVIARERDVELEAGIPIPEREALEARVDGLSPERVSLVTPIGGLSAYPAMILEIDSLVWLADTFAHEWTHHYLVFHPLGLNYDRSGEMTSINETSASIVGREIGRRVIVRYYPELIPSLPPLPAPPDEPPMTPGELVWPEEPPAGQFDFTREMRVTRLRVDELLESGKVEEAEAYMEVRRLVFVEHGYRLRKLNQAYFAFNGSYATNPSAANPIGGQLEWLRGQSGTLRAYLKQVSAFSRYQDLLSVLPQGTR
jgi:hypothetical protein